MLNTEKHDDSLKAVRQSDEIQMENYKSMIFTCFFASREGKIIWKTTDWEKPNETRILSDDTLECIRERREAKQNKKEERKKQQRKR